MSNIANVPPATIFAGATKVREYPKYGPEVQVATAEGWNDSCIGNYTGVASFDKGVKDWNGKHVFISYDQGMCYHAEQDGKIICWFYASNMCGDPIDEAWERSCVKKWNDIVERSKQ